MRLPLSSPFAIGWRWLFLLPVLLLDLLSRPAALAQTRTGYHWTTASQPTNQSGAAEFTAISVASNGDQYVGGNAYAATVLAGVSLPAAPAYAGSPFADSEDGTVPRRGSCAFVGKRNNAGTWQWVRPIGSTTCDAVVSKVVTVNPTSTFTYVTGSLRGSFAFGATTLNCPTDWGAFIACLDENGNWRWATQAHFDDIVSTTNTLGLELTVGLRQVGASILTDVYAVGSFNGRALFGNGFANLTTPYRHRNTFVAKLDGATGAWQWVRQAGSTVGPISPGGTPSSTCDPAGAGLDAAGNLYLAANYFNSYGSTVQGNLDAQGRAGALRWSKLTELVVAKLSPAGTWQWVRADSTSYQYPIYRGYANRQLYTSLAAAPDGGVVVSGRPADGTNTAGVPAITLSPFPTISGWAYFTTRMNAATGAREWLTPESANDLTIAPNGTIWLARNVNTPFTFGAFGRPFTPSGPDAFFGTLNAAGQPQNGQLLGGSGTEVVNAIAVTPPGTGTTDALVVGSFRSGNIPFTSPMLVNSIVGGTTPLPFIARSTVAVPVLTAITPTQGPVGTLLTLTGTDFYNVEQVLVGGVAAVFTRISPTQLTATVPATVPAGLAQVAVVTASDPGTPVPVYFTVLAAPAGITFSPGFGAIGTPVTLRGTGFTGATLVKFGGTTTTNFSIISDQEIRVNVPSMGVSLVKISVVNPAGTGISAANFGVGIAPTISSISPATGAAGTSFSISGAALGGATGVYIGTTLCAILTNTATTITATVPNALAGAVRVSTPYGTASGATFSPTAPVPTISGFSPGSGPAGTSVNVSGTNLNWVSQATVNGLPATITAQTATSLTLTVPDCTTGRIRLTGPGGTATSATDFIVPTPPAPAWAWAQKTTGALAFQLAKGVAADLQGNTYVVGNFSGQAVFGTHTLVSQGTSDGFVAKQAANGTWAWAARLGGYGDDAAQAVAVLPGGRLVVVGSFEQTLTVGTTTVTSAGESDAFAAFLNADGSGRTVYRGGSARYDIATAVCAQPNGTVWVAGDGATNGGSGTAVAFGPAAYALRGAGSAFVARLTEGTGFAGVASVLAFDGLSSVHAAAVAVSPGGTLALAGRYANRMALGSSPTFSYAASGSDAFVAVTAVTAPTGYWDRVLTAVSSNDDQATGLAFTGEDLCVAGEFRGDLLTPFGTVLLSAATTDGYLLRYPASPLNGLTLPTTAIRFGGPGTERVNALALDASGNATVTGSYEGSIAFGPTALTAATGTGTARDLYVARLSATNQWSWATSAGTAGQFDEGRALTLDAAGNVVLAATVTGSQPATFGALPALSTPTGFVTAKLGTATVPAPTISILTPTSGPRGTVVTVTGTNLASVNDIEFVGGPDYVNYADISAISNTALTFAVPAGATTGAIRVTTAGGVAQTPGAFTVTGPTNLVFSPATGLPGTLVTILGVGFANVTAVRFGGVALPAANYTVVSSSTIRAYVDFASLTGPISVQTVVGTGTSAGTFTVIPGPTISAISPLSGPVGTVVTITGANFSNVTRVRLGAEDVDSYTVVSPTTITAVVPDSIASGPFSVEAGGSVTASFGTTFTVTQPVPTISSFTPPSGPIGTTVTITGIGFALASGVSFNNIPCPAGSWTVQSATTILASVPATATTGLVRVTTPGGVAVSSTNFTVTSPPAPPTLTGFTPGSGPVGTSVTLTGTNLDGVTGVTFNGTAATIQTFNPTQLTVTVPAGATTGAIAVTTPGGSATAPGSFSVTAPAASGWPTSVTSSGNSQAKATVTDAAGNVYVAGFFSGTASFGGLSVTSASEAGFVVKYNSAGVGQWVRAIGDMGQVEISGLDVDANGSVYIAGTFYNAITYPQGAGTATLPNPNGTTQRGFVGQLAPNGVIQFLTGFGGTQPTEVRDLVVDLNGVVYVGGLFQQALRFDLNPQLVLNGSGPSDGFVVALNTGTGQWAWVTRCGGSGSDDFKGLAIDLTNQALYACGTFEAGSFALSGVQQPLTNQGGIDLWVARLTTGGVGVWTKGGASNSSDYANDVAVGPNGTVYVLTTGFAAGTLGPNTVSTPNGSAWVAVARLSSAGAWQTGVAVAGGGTSASFFNFVAPSRLAVAADGVATLTGYGAGQALFGGTALNGLASNYYALAARTTAAATGWQWAQALGDGDAANQSYGTAVALAPTGTDAYVAGVFSGALTVNGTTLTTGGFVNNAYVARVSGPAGPPAAPTVTNLSPNSGPTGTSVTFTGTNLLGTTAVSFNGAAATFSSVTATSLTATVPAAATSGPVSVTTPGGSVSGPAFLVTASQPVISSFNPTSGPAGTSVTLSGQHLGLATDVRFNGVSATITGNTATLLTCTVPAGATTGTIAVTTTGGTGTSATAFTVTGAAVNTPVITAISPLHGPEGSQVTISGQYLTTATQVRFNGLATSFYVSGPNLVAQVPVGATSGTIAVTTPVDDAGSPQPFELDLLVLSDATVSFGLYYDVTVAPGATLTLGGAALGVSHAMLVRNRGAVDFAGAVVIGNGTFTSEANTTLTLYQPEGLTLAPATQGDVQLTGARSFAADADYVYAGGAQQTGAALPATVRNLTLSGGNLTLTNPLAVRQVLRLSGAGNLLTNSRMLTLRSDATATAMLVNGGAGRVIGTATVERYITPDVAPGLGYRHFSSPTTASAVSDLAAPGFTPLVNPTYNALPYVAPPTAQFPNVFGFDETRGGTTPAYQDFATGWVSPATLGTVLTPGRGFSVLLTSTVKPDFTGTLNQNDLTLTGLTRTGTGTGNNDKSGWHLLGNSFAAPLNWDLVPVPTGLSASISVFKTQGGNNGVFLTRANGVGSLPDGLIPAAQGFFTRVTGTGPVDLTLPSAARATTYVNPAHYRAAPSATDTRPLISLTLNHVGAPDTQRDEAFVYFQTGATAGSDNAFDGAKPGHNTGAVPTLASLTNTHEELAVNGLSPADLTTGTTVPLLAVAPAAGNYTLKVSQLRNFDNQPLTLVDALTGTRYNLRTQPALTFRADQPGEIRGRFRLEFGQRVLGSETDIRTAAAPLQVWPNPARATQTVQVSGLPGNTALQLLDATGRVVRTNNEQPANNNLIIKGLAPGVYVLRAGALTQRLVVE